MAWEGERRLLPWFYDLCFILFIDFQTDLNSFSSSHYLSLVIDLFLYQLGISLISSRLLVSFAFASLSHPFCGYFSNVTMPLYESWRGWIISVESLYSDGLIVLYCDCSTSSMLCSDRLFFLGRTSFLLS